jgi:hypothetical protein
VKRFLAATALALAICAPVTAHAYACDQECRDYKVSHGLRTRDDFIGIIFSDPRISSAHDAVSEACNRAAETGYEVDKRDRDCDSALRTLQQQAWRVTVELYKSLEVRNPRYCPQFKLMINGWKPCEDEDPTIAKPGHERESEILIELFTEANGSRNDNPWWFEGAE